MRPTESFIEQPIRSLQTMLRVLAEDDAHLPTVIPDGIYGPTTMHAVTAFQRRQGIGQTGITDQETWESIVEQYEDALIRIDKAEPIEIIMDAGQVYHGDDQHPNIYLLQSLLTVLSFDYPSIISPDHTGILDTATQESLRNFQTLANLPQTGELDKISWKNLVKQFTLSSHRYTNQNK
jgi:peptidoglycan hydrolase-like protein with peptidoglycan-binding domain